MSYFTINTITLTHSSSYGPLPLGSFGSYSKVQVKVAVYPARAPGTYAIQIPLKTYTVADPLSSTGLNKWTWSQPKIGFDMPLNASFEVELWCEGTFAASKRIYGTQLSYIAMGVKNSFKWKMHTPSSTATLTGDLSMDIVRSMDAASAQPPPQSVSPTPMLTTPIPPATPTPSYGTSSTYVALGQNRSISSGNLTLGLATSSQPSQPAPVRTISTTTRNLRTSSSSISAWTSTMDAINSSQDLSHDAPIPKAIPKDSATAATSQSTPTLSGLFDTIDQLSSEPSSSNLASSATLSPPVAQPARSSSKLLASGSLFQLPPAPVPVQDFSKTTIPEPGEMSMAESETLGIYNPTTQSLTKRQTPIGISGTRFMRVACSMFGAIAIAEDGSLNYWTLDSTGERHTEGGPVPKLEGRTIVDIAAGHDHFLAVTVEGELYAWGSNQFSQCGVQGASRIFTPTKLCGNISACSAGGHASLAIDTDGLVYTWGRAQTAVTVSLTSEIVLTDSQKQQMAAGTRPRTLPTHRTIAIDALAHGDKSVASRQDPLRVSHPTLVFFEEHLAFLHASISSTRGVLVARDGRVFAWGDSSAICSSNSEEHSAIPVPIQFAEGVRIVRALAGDSYCLALDSTGHLWSWGSRKSTAPTKITFGEDNVVIDFGISAKSAFAIVSSDDIYVWNLDSDLTRLTSIKGERPASISHGTSSLQVCVAFSYHKPTLTRSSTNSDASSSIMSDFAVMHAETTDWYPEDDLN